MYRYLSVIALSILTFLTVNIFAVQAQGETLLPGTKEEDDACIKIVGEFQETGEIPTNEDVDKIEKLSSDLDSSFLKHSEAQTAYDEAKKKAADTTAEYLKKDENSLNCLTNPKKPPKCSGLLVDNQNAVAAAKEAEAEAKKAKAEMDKLSKEYDEVNPGQKDVETLVGVRDNLLGCAIKTGRISLNMIPYFISYMANWLLGLSGIVSVLFIVLGGYYYIYGGITDAKDKGKKTIANALMGMSLAILSWVIVSIIIAAVTS